MARVGAHARVSMKGMMDMDNPLIIREARDDDYTLFPGMISNYIKRGKTGKATEIPFCITADELKKTFSEQGEDGIKGVMYVAEDDKGICGLLGVNITPESNGVLSIPGFRDGLDLRVFRHLLAKCEEFIRSFGGVKITANASLDPGSVRGPNLSFYEAMGFTVDSHFYDLTSLVMADWMGPTIFGETDSETIRILSLEEISHAVERARKDGNPDFAELGKSLSPSGLNPRKMYLSYHIPGEIEAKGYAYFELIDRGYEDALMACGLSFHFIDGTTVREKRHFMEGTLSAIKQLGVVFIWSEQNSRDYAAYMELLRQGFDATGPWQVRLTKSL